MDNLVIDFYCPKLKLAIEIDGDSHFGISKRYDHERQEFIGSYGIRFLRFTNIEIYEDLNGVLDVIINNLP